MQVQLTSNNILSKFRAARKALLVVSWCFVCSIPLTLFHITRQRHLRNKLLLIIYKGAAWIANVHVHHRGKLPKEYRSLLVTNHCSYLDVIALGSLLPICFTPKKDIASWPVIGFLCKMAGVVFIERRPSKTAAHMKELEEKLDGRQMVPIMAVN
jgi:1-acyl-sn-glycerol-3-phosphate acyltransferase